MIWGFVDAGVAPGRPEGAVECVGMPRSNSSNPALDPPSGRSGTFPTELSEPGTYFLGRYRVVDEIGIGGMASVHLARMDGEGGFQKWVAIKKIHPHLVEDEQFINMFLDEARIAARISHPNVAQVFDLGRHEDTYWIAMEYLHGEPLREVVRYNEERGVAMPPELAARVVADAAEGLHAAHELRGKRGEPLNLVHRDVTPHNLFVTYEGIAKVVDFGIAKVAGRLANTGAGTLKGKLAYMSPEQVRGGEIDRRTDVFALGVVLWELTVGGRLFRMETDIETLEKVQTCIVPSPSSIRPDFPAELESVVMRALEKRPEARFQTARELSRALQHYLVHAGVLVGHEEIATYVSKIFGDRINTREAHLRWAAEVTQTLALSQLRGKGNATPSVGHDEDVDIHWEEEARPRMETVPAVPGGAVFKTTVASVEPIPTPQPPRGPITTEHGIHLPAPRAPAAIVAPPVRSVVITTTPPPWSNDSAEPRPRAESIAEEIPTLVTPSRPSFKEWASGGAARAQGEKAPIVGLPEPKGDKEVTRGSRRHGVEQPLPSASRQLFGAEPQAAPVEPLPPSSSTSPRHVAVGVPGGVLPADRAQRPLAPAASAGVPGTASSPVAVRDSAAPAPVRPPTQAAVEPTPVRKAPRTGKTGHWVATGVVFVAVAALSAGVLLRVRGASEKTSDESTDVGSAGSAAGTGASATSGATTAGTAQRSADATSGSAGSASGVPSTGASTTSVPTAVGTAQAKPGEAGRPGFLALTCSPSCDLVYTGLYNLGASPIAHAALPPGDYRVTLRRGKSTKVISVSIVSGQTASHFVPMD